MRNDRVCCHLTLEFCCEGARLEPGCRRGTLRALVSSNDSLGRGSLGAPALGRAAEGKVRLRVPSRQPIPRRAAHSRAAREAGPVDRPPLRRAPLGAARPLARYLMPGAASRPAARPVKHTT